MRFFQASGCRPFLITFFEPQVTQRPEQVETGYGNLILCGDTYVECEYRYRCKAIYEYLEKEKK